ncbi:hypothetical protein [Streptomyces sp. NPDC005533]
MIAEPAAFRPFPHRITLGDGPVIETEATLVAVRGDPQGRCR